MNRSFLITIIMALALQSASSYTITPKVTYQGANFFPQFNFFTEDDYTHGYVNYVNQSYATDKKLIAVNSDGSVYIGTDSTNIGTGRGRDSVRLESKARYNNGTLIIGDIAHMPSGCGTWPAFWTVGQNSPTTGEIDLIESVNNDDANHMALHTSKGCAMNISSNSQFTGTWEENMLGKPSNNCYDLAANQYEDAGCGIAGATGSYGVPFNKNGGGVYAILWTNTEISGYYFPRASIPADIKSKTPDPTKWGKPFAKFQLGTNCPVTHFKDHNIIINLTYCGDWAGSAFGDMCPGLGDCNAYVQNNPAAFKDAYWIFNSIIVYNVAA